MPIASEDVVWTPAPAVPVPFASFATASADGALIALAIDDQVALVHMAQPPTVEQVPGWLVPGPTPLVATLDGAGDVVSMHDAVRGLDYQAPSGLGGIDWNERTAWLAGDGVLVRAVTAKTMRAAHLVGYPPGSATPSWQTDLDLGIADVALAGDRVVVQLTDAQGRAELAAFGVRDGKPVWRVPTAATVYDEGALAIGDGVVLSVLGNAAKCDSCEQVELHDLATGKVTRTVALDGPTVLYRGELGNRGLYTALGIAGDELWVRFHQLGGGADSMRAKACTFDVFDLGTGKRRAARGAWDAMMTACEAPVLTAPIPGGLVAIQHDDTKLDVARLSAAP